MSERFYTLPVTHAMGTTSSAGGRSGVELLDKDRVNAGIIVPRSGTVNIWIVVIARDPRSGVQIFRGYSTGPGDFEQSWLPPSGLAPINITAPRTYHKIQVLSGIQVTEGNFLGVRIANRTEGYQFALSNIYMEYM